MTSPGYLDSSPQPSQDPVPDGSIPESVIPGGPSTDLAPANQFFYGTPQSTELEQRRAIAERFLDPANEAAFNDLPEATQANLRAIAGAPTTIVDHHTGRLSPTQPSQPAEVAKATSAPLAELGEAVLDVGTNGSADSHPVSEHKKGVDGLYSRLDELGQASILERAEFHGMDFGEENLKVNVDRLKEYGLEPKYTVSLGDGVSIHFSDAGILSFQEDRPAVVGYVETPDGEVVARTYYLSGSHVVWRYLPAWSIGHLSKVHSEDALALPPIAQAALGDISQTISKKLPTEVVWGTARMSSKMGGEGAVTYIAKVKKAGDCLDGNFYADRRALVPPHDLLYDSPGQMPDFDNELYSWTQQSPVHGRVELAASRSSDGAFTYIMATDSNGHSWNTSIQNNSPISRLGVHETFVDGGCPVTPLIDYKGQDGGYGEAIPGKDDDYPYVSMWRNYLSQTSPIQRYTLWRQSKGKVASF